MSLREVESGATGAIPEKTQDHPLDHGRVGSEAARIKGNLPLMDARDPSEDARALRRDHPP
ncbi:MAG TPA: hypothetical protein VJY35_02940, partial [Candidatus Eisenbacteria bacterium]|nr:hypothetical protein [Candidatus Eisenbacteria bacterium]